MSNHVGVVRIGVQTSVGVQPMLDVLYDTTEGEQLRAFCHVGYYAFALELAELLASPGELGKAVQAY